MARPYQLWRTVSVDSIFGSEPLKSISTNSCRLYPLVARRACFPSLSGRMFSGRSEVTTCRPTGVRCQPLGRRNPVSVGPANVALSWATSGAALMTNAIGGRRSMVRSREGGWLLPMISESGRVVQRGLREESVDSSCRKGWETCPTGRIHGHVSHPSIPWDGLGNRSHGTLDLLL